MADRRGQLIKVQGEIPTDAAVFSFVQVMVVQSSPWVFQVTDETKVYPIPPALHSDTARLVELCSGIGCASTEAERAGFQVIAAVDHNPKWQPIFDSIHPTISPSVYIAGDAASAETKKSLLDRQCQHAVFLAGVDCQPYSRLGDGNGMRDSRACSLQKVLDTAWVCQASCLILECVPQIAHNKEAQDIMREFSARTGFHMTQHEQHLHTAWCSRRSRWFAVFTAPTFGPCTVPPLPLHPELAQVQQVMPFARRWNDQHIQQLSLNLYELAKFDAYAPGQIQGSFLKADSSMPTSLHSAGNQMYPCQCGCRGALSEARLSQDGLHATLIPMEGCTKHLGKMMPHARYLHPQEMFLLNAGDPTHNFGDNMRLALAGVGQCISPIVALWVLTHVKQHMDSHLDLDPVFDPQTVHDQYVTEVLSKVQQMWISGPVTTEEHLPVPALTTPSHTHVHEHDTGSKSMDDDTQMGNSTHVSTASVPEVPTEALVPAFDTQAHAGDPEVECDETEALEPPSDNVLPTQIDTPAVPDDGETNCHKDTAAGLLPMPSSWNDQNNVLAAPIETAVPVPDEAKDSSTHDTRPTEVPKPSGLPSGESGLLPFRLPSCGFRGIDSLAVPNDKPEVAVADAPGFAATPIAVQSQVEPCTPCPVSGGLSSFRKRTADACKSPNPRQ